MQVQPNYNRNLKENKAAKVAPRDLLPRYLRQLNNLLSTARRMNNRRVVTALTGLIAKRARMN